LQQKRKSPVEALNSTMLPLFESSIRHVENTVKGNEQVAVLFDPSVAVQVTVVVPTGKIEPGAGLQITLTPGQLSAAPGIA
jgi:hypothetical protein